MQGDQVKALKILSRAKGWDPDKIYDAKAKSYGDSIENFNRPPQVFTNQAGTGQLPEGLHDSYPQAEEPRYKENTTNNDGITWNTPQVSRETVNRATKNGTGF